MNNAERSKRRIATAARGWRGGWIKGVKRTSENAIGAHAVVSGKRSKFYTYERAQRIVLRAKRMGAADAWIAPVWAA